jgi:hypothetical protein
MGRYEVVGIYQREKRMDVGISLDPAGSKAKTTPDIPILPDQKPVIIAQAEVEIEVHVLEVDEELAVVARGVEAAINLATVTHGVGVWSLLLAAEK